MDQVGQELRVVHHLIRASEIGVLVTQRVEAVRAGRDDRLHARAVQRRDVFARQPLKRVFVAHAPCRITGAALTLSQDREIDPRHLQQLRGRDRGPAGALIERRRAADPEEDFGRAFSRLQNPDAQAFGPLQAIGLRFAPGVRRAIDVAQHRARLFRKTRLDHDQVAAQVDHVVDVLDADRALPHARAAGDAVPHDVVGQCVRHDRRGQELRREGFAGRVGRAHVLAAPALRARHGVEHLLPRHIRRPSRAETDFSLGLFEIDRLDSAA